MKKSLTIGNQRSQLYDFLLINPNFQPQANKDMDSIKKKKKTPTK